jgi:CDP-diacylglycerol--glycerol-3-phosphate 3-phosphatidyltransferase
VLESEGKDFSATMSGKLKMVVQCVAVAGSQLYLEYARDATSAAMLTTARDVLLWSAVVITLYSGYDYVVRAVRMFRTG